MWSRLWVWCIGLAWGVAAAQALPPIQVSILPTLTAKALLTQYHPLRVYLERELQRPVDMRTAPDFKRFHAETLAGNVDLVLTAAHLARHAQTESGYVPLATFTSPNQPMVVMSQRKPVQSVAELRGHALAVFDPVALVVLEVQQWLADQGLQAGRDYKVAVFPSHASVAHAVMAGDALLGVTATVGLNLYTAEMKEQLRVFAERPSVPALVWMLHPRQSSEAPRVKAALLAFGQATEGKQFFTSNGYRSLRAVEDRELAALDRSAREAAALLKGAQ